MTSVIGLNHKRDEIEQGHKQGVLKNYMENKTVLNQQANIQSLKKKKTQHKMAKPYSMENNTSHRKLRLQMSNAKCYKA